jgi:hypothetical protein
MLGANSKHASLPDDRSEKSQVAWGQLALRVTGMSETEARRTSPFLALRASV